MSQPPFETLEPIYSVRDPKTGKIKTTHHSYSVHGEIAQRIENAKADTLVFCIDYLTQSGMHEAAAKLGDLWDQPPQPQETK